MENLKTICSLHHADGMGIKMTIYVVGTHLKHLWAASNEYPHVFYGELGKLYQSYSQIPVPLFNKSSGCAIYKKRALRAYSHSLIGHFIAHFKELMDTVEYLYFDKHRGL